MGNWSHEDHAADSGSDLPQGHSNRRRVGNPGLDRKGKPWLECAGELAHLHAETVRIEKIIEEEFEQIEPEDLA
jgi:hypothetical protein